MADNDYFESAKILAPAVCWLTGAVLILITCAGGLDDPYATAGMAFVVVGCTLTLCCRLRGLAAREREAFEMGRDSMRIVRD